MKGNQDVLEQQLREQIALEEHLCKAIQEQVEEIRGAEFADARTLLQKTCEALELHFTPLNKLLDGLDQVARHEKAKAISRNGGGLIDHLAQGVPKQSLSKILRDDYSALNLVTISNTLLHTTALALEAKEVASTALKHLENLAPLVVRIGEIVPEVITRELRSGSPNIDLAVAQTALKNTQLAWRKVS